MLVEAPKAQIFLGRSYLPVGNGNGNTTDRQAVERDREGTDQMYPLLRDPEDLRITVTTLPPVSSSSASSTGTDDAEAPRSPIQHQQQQQSQDEAIHSSSKNDYGHVSCFGSSPRRPLVAGGSHTSPGCATSSAQESGGSSGGGRSSGEFHSEETSLEEKVRTEASAGASGSGGNGGGGNTSTTPEISGRAEDVFDKNGDGGGQEKTMKIKVELPKLSLSLTPPARRALAGCIGGNLLAAGFHGEFSENFPLAAVVPFTTTEAEEDDNFLLFATAGGRQEAGQGEDVNVRSSPRAPSSAASSYENSQGAGVAACGSCAGLFDELVARHRCGACGASVCRGCLHTQVC